MHRTLTGLAVLALLPSLSVAAINAPQLKWSNAGCFETWCLQGWYSSPAIADLDGDGAIEVVAASYWVFALAGTDGSTVWSLQPGGDTTGGGSSQRTWSAVVVADVDNDTRLEVVTAHAGGWLSIYDEDGRFETGWPQQPTTSELRGVKAFDIDGDDRLEIIATAVGSQTNTWVYEDNGALRSGWPQLGGGPGFAFGAYNDNAAVADLNGLPGGEILVPSDTSYVAGYDADGIGLDAASLFGSGKVWGEIAAWESPIPEERGWGQCDGTRVESHRANFATGAAVVSDVDLDGTPELVVSGDMYDCSTGPYESRFTTAFIFNADRTRFASGPWDWSIPAIDTGAPLVQDYNVIENSMPDPVTADLDGDGIQEILFSSYDGRVHAVWLDGTEHDSWALHSFPPRGGQLRPGIATRGGGPRCRRIGRGAVHLLAGQGDDRNGQAAHTRRLGPDAPRDRPAGDAGRPLLERSAGLPYSRQYRRRSRSGTGRQHRPVGHRRLRPSRYGRCPRAVVDRTREQPAQRLVYRGRAGRHRQHVAIEQDSPKRPRAELGSGVGRDPIRGRSRRRPGPR